MGIVGGRSRQAERMLCLAGGSWSYERASHYLAELSGLHVCANTVRSVCHAEAACIERWQSQPIAGEKHRKTPGNDEFETDGTCVNTTEGWKEMRVGVFVKRPAGEPATPDEWATRKLPRPASRIAFAAIEDHVSFAARWQPTAARLGIRPNAALAVYADGARWIWDQVNYHFAFAKGTLDVYHALEHVSATGKALYGEGTVETTRWQDEARETLLADGWPGIERVIHTAGSNAVRASQRTALTQLKEYLQPHAEHLNYAERLAQGRPIGSGLIEGACKNYLGRRMKQTGARWLIPNANRMATVGSLIYADQWGDYWANPN